MEMASRGVCVCKDKRGRVDAKHNNALSWGHTETHTDQLMKNTNIYCL